MNYFNVIKKYPSVILVVVSNFYPLMGVMFWGWQVKDVMATFLIESLIIGGLTVAKILTVNEKMVTPRRRSRQETAWRFLIVYGGLNAIYFLVLTLFFKITVEDWEKVWLVCIPMVISHGFSFVSNYWMNERNTVSMGRIVIAPLFRIFPMQYAVVIGAGFFGVFGGDSSGVMMLGVLMSVKTVIDVISHLYERKVFYGGVWKKTGQTKMLERMEKAVG